MEKVNENEYIVDGIVFKRDKECLVMSFRVGGMEHTFRVQMANAIKMAQVLQKLFLEKN